MAIKKLISDERGIEVEYWFINDKKWDKGTQTTRVRFFGFKNKTYRDQDIENHLLTREAVFEGDFTVPEVYIASMGEGFLSGGEEC